MDTGSLESALSECNISQLSRLAEGASKWNLIWDQPTDGYFVAPSGGDNAEVAGLIKECKDVLTPIVRKSPLRLDMTMLTQHRSRVS